jgi:hypothetical protein
MGSRIKPYDGHGQVAEAGLDLAIGRNATLGVSYVGRIASNVSDHAAKGKFIWWFQTGVSGVGAKPTCRRDRSH